MFAKIAHRFYKSDNFTRNNLCNSSILSTKGQKTCLRVALNDGSRAFCAKYRGIPSITYWKYFVLDRKIGAEPLQECTKDIGLSVKEEEY